MPDPTRPWCVRAISVVVARYIKRLCATAAAASIDIVTGFPEIAPGQGGRCYNCAVWITQAGQIHHVYRKTHLWTGEEAAFAAWHGPDPYVALTLALTVMASVRTSTWIFSVVQLWPAVPVFEVVNTRQCA